MPTSRTKTRRHPLLEKACECLPNCSKALELVETGCERELSPGERVALKYHGRLCPFCACATGKFEAAMARMREAEAVRARAGGS